MIQECISCNNLVKYLSWSTDAYCGKEFGLEFHSSGFGIFDLGPKSAPNTPGLETSLRDHL